MTSSPARAFFRLLVSSFFLTAIVPASAWATDPTSPEEALGALYKAGRVNEGREGFRSLTDARLAAVDAELEKEWPESPMETANELAGISESLTSWEALEILFQLSGGETPSSVYQHVERTLQRVAGLMEGVKARKIRSQEDQASLRGARRVLTESFTKAIAFLQWQVSPETRRELLACVVRWGGSPITLDEFDAAHSDLVETFQIVGDPRLSLDDPAQALALLNSVMPAEPAVVTPALVSLLHRVGSTKRLDAAVLLIRALAFNWSVSGSNEYRSLFGMVTAAPILQKNYGSSVLPLLFYSGVTTDKEWLQRRIVLVIREVGTEAEIALLREAFSLKESNLPAVRRFAELLDTKDLQIHLADRRDVKPVFQ